MLEMMEVARYLVGIIVYCPFEDRVKDDVLRQPTGAYLNHTRHANDLGSHLSQSCGCPWCPKSGWYCNLIHVLSFTEGPGMENDAAIEEISPRLESLYHVHLLVNSPLTIATSSTPMCRCF